MYMTKDRVYRTKLPFLGATDWEVLLGAVRCEKRPYGKKFIFVLVILSESQEHQESYAKN